MELSEEEFNAWKGALATKAVMALFMARRTELMENWAAGAKDEQAVGMCQALKAVINLSYDELGEFRGE